MEPEREAIERWKTEYPGKWKEAQRLAQESFGLVPETPEFEEKAELLFIELGGGCVDYSDVYQCSIAHNPIHL